MAQRVGRGIALLFHDRGTRNEGEWSAARPGRTLPPGKDPVPNLQMAGWALVPVWTGGKSPGFDPGPSSPLSVAMQTEIPGPRFSDRLTILKFA